jgi:hypothetical protein
LLLVLSTFLCTIKLDNGGIMGFDECFYAQKAKEIERTIADLEAKAEALHYFPMWRTWFGLVGYFKARSKVSLLTSCVAAAVLVLSALPGVFKPAFRSSLALTMLFSYSSAIQ